MSDMRFVRVIREEQGVEEISTYIKLDTTVKLPGIRELLEINSTIVMDDTFFFTDRNSNSITRKKETEYSLKDIIVDETIFLKTCEPNEDHLKSRLKLEYGRTSTPFSVKIKTAEKKAFTIGNIKFTKPDVSSNDETINFSSKGDWEKKRNMFFNAKVELMNFGTFDLPFTNTQSESQETEKKFSYNYTKISKMHLKFEGLSPEVDFKEEVEKAVESQDREKLGEIIKKFGQFIPTRVTLGGIVYYVTKRQSNISSRQNINEISPTISVPTGIPAVNLNIGAGINRDISNSESTSLEREYSCLIGGELQDLKKFDRGNWINSLCDYKTWNCIEFQDPIHIFELLGPGLRKKIYKILGKKILYCGIMSHKCHLEYGEREIVNLRLQDKICETIKKKEADCSVFATIVGDKKNDFYNCQIYHPRENNEKPKLIIHCYQNNQKDQPHSLKIGFMIVGYDFDFSNDENDDTRLEVHYKDYQNSNNQELTQFNFDQNTFHTFLGIPVLNELNNSDDSILIGHYFLKRNDTIEANVFSYSLNDNKYVNLPNFRFQVLAISGYHRTCKSILFKKRFIRFMFMRQRRYINIESIEKMGDGEIIPYISVYSVSCGPVFLKQKRKEIKLKYANCKCKRTCSVCRSQSLERDIRCICFVSNKGNFY
jgi:hypothetical protein